MLLLLLPLDYKLYAVFAKKKDYCPLVAILQQTNVTNEILTHGGVQQILLKFLQ